MIKKLLVSSFLYALFSAGAQTKQPNVIFMLADDLGYGISLDSSGNAYIVGYISSPNYPTVNAIQPTYGGPGGDGCLPSLSMAAGRK